MQNLSDALYENMMKSWPYWIVVGETKDGSGEYAIWSVEVQAKHRTNAKMQAHAERTGLGGISFIEAVYGPYRKDE